MCLQMNITLSYNGAPCLHTSLVRSDLLHLKALQPNSFLILHWRTVYPCKERLPLTVFPCSLLRSLQSLIFSAHGTIISREGFVIHTLNSFLPRISTPSFQQLKVSLSVHEPVGQWTKTSDDIQAVNRDMFNLSKKLWWILNWHFFCLSHMLIVDLHSLKYFKVSI